MNIFTSLQIVYAYLGRLMFDVYTCKYYKFIN